MTWRTPAEHLAWRHRHGRNQPCDLQAAVILLDFPGVSVSVNVGLDLFAGKNDFEKSDSVFEAHISADAGVMMD